MGVFVRASVCVCVMTDLRTCTVMQRMRPRTTGLHSITALCVEPRSKNIYISGKKTLRLDRIQPLTRDKSEAKQIVFAEV